jgi:hypothetical protein
LIDRNSKIETETDTCDHAPRKGSNTSKRAGSNYSKIVEKCSKIIKK